MKNLMELISAKGKDVKGDSLKAKMEVLKDLKSMAMKAMGDKLDGAKKVEIAADSKEGLEAGLDKAKELLNPEEEEKEESAEDELAESPEKEAEELASNQEESEEDLDKKIQELMAKKAALKK